MEIVFLTYAPNDPNLIEKLSDKGVSISAAPIDEKMPSSIWCFTFMVSNVVVNCSLDFFHETDARWQRWSDGLWKIKSKDDE
jgi:hypothetical protein